MGLTAIPFAIDINKVKNVLGCKDSHLLEKIKTADLYETYADQSEDYPDPTYRYNFDQALEDLIFRYVKPADREKVKSSFFGLKKSKPDTGLKENMEHAYGYALLVICDYMGEHFLSYCDGFYCGQAFKAAVKIMKAKGLQIDLNRMFESQDVFDIPKLAEPGIQLYSRQDIDHIVSVMEQVDIDESQTDPDSEGFDEVQEMLKNIRDSFRTCKEQNLEMVTFTH